MGLIHNNHIPGDGFQNIQNIIRTDKVDGCDQFAAGSKYIGITIKNGTVD